MTLKELIALIVILFAFTLTVNANSLPKPKKPVICVQGVFHE